jgi:hypothetical protein
VSFLVKIYRVEPTGVCTRQTDGVDDMDDSVSVLVSWSQQRILVFVVPEEEENSISNSSGWGAEGR